MGHAAPVRMVAERRTLARRHPRNGVSVRRAPEVYRRRAMAPRRRPRVSFVTYEATRTGSPMVLLRLLRWLEANATLDLEVICWRGGPLLDDFRAVAEVRSLAPLDRRTLVETAETGADELGLAAIGRQLGRARVAVGLRRRQPVDLVYLNGAPSLVALPHLHHGSAPVLVHIHELEYALERSLPRGEEGLLRRPDRYIAVAQVVADNLVEHHGIEPGKIAVRHGFVDDRRAAAVAAPADLRQRLGIPTRAPVVGAVGDLIWRKGPDVFLQVAAAVGGSGEAAPHFVWVGGSGRSAMYREARHDLSALGLDGRVHMVGEQEHPGDWYELFDVLALTSREDPFPLAMLEAAQAGTPVVSFAQGGAPEFLLAEGGDVGVVVPMLDVATMASTIDGLLADTARRVALGERAAERVRGAFVTSVVAPRLLAEIEELL